MVYPMRCFLLMVSLIFLGGCAKSTGRVPVKGTVSFHSLPLPHGSIQFFTQKGDKAEAAGGASISKGAFLIPASHGLLPGSYKVVISCAEEATKLPKGFQKGSSLPTEEKLPPEFSTLEKTKATAEVTLDGKNTFDFVIP